MGSHGVGTTTGCLALTGLLVVVAGCVGGYKPDLQSPDPAARIRAIVEVANEGKTSAVPALVDRLEDEDEGVRFYAIEALKRLTGEDMGYRYYESAYERRPAVERWRRYARQHEARTPTSRSVAAES